MNNPAASGRGNDLRVYGKEKLIMKKPLLLLVVSVYLISGIASCGGSSGGSSSGSNTVIANNLTAYTYDDFNGTSIDAAKWTASKTNPSDPDYFTQSNGLLNFQVTAGNAAVVAAKQLPGPGFYSIQFYDFFSTNFEEPTSHRGAFLGLGLGTRNNFVRIIRCQNGHKDSTTNVITYYGVFEANYIQGKTSTSDGVQVYVHTTNVNSGQLGLYYDGSKVTFYYNPDPTAETGWKTIRTDNGDNGAVLQWDPHQEQYWSDPPSLYISGSDISGTTGFKVDNVRYRPEPPQVQ
jgi:hypothetical protein